MTRVLVLGGTRFLGPPVVQQLVQAGHDVTIFHRGEREAPEAAQAEHVHGEFARLSDYMPRLSRSQPEVVLDLVPYIDKGGHGARHFRGIAARAVVVTSLDVYRAFAIAWGSEHGPIEPMPATEDSPTRSSPAPDLTPDIDFDNLEVERALAGDGSLPLTVLRLPMIYGVGDPQRRLARYVRRMSDGRPAIILDARIAARRWSRGYVENVAAAVALAVVHPRAQGHTYNVAEAVTPTEAEWVASIARTCGWNGAIVRVPSEGLPDSMRSRLREDQDLVVSSDRIRRKLGFAEPVPAPEGLRRAVEWEQAQQAHEPRPDYGEEDRVLGSIARSG